MIEALRFVQGAVAKKDYVPALTFFQIKNGRILGSNGRLSLSAPISLDFEACPEAIPFIKAIEKCSEMKGEEDKPISIEEFRTCRNISELRKPKQTLSITLTPGGKLGVKKGQFKAFINCLGEPETFPNIEITGTLEFKLPILSVFKTLSPFMGIDASRQWSNGILLINNFAYTTNNIVLLEHKLPCSIKGAVNIPSSAVKEVLRINEEPESVLVDTNSIVFKYSDNRWLKSIIHASSKWPNAATLLNQPSTQKPVIKEMFAALQNLTAFLDEHEAIYFHKGELCTHRDEGIGASYEVAGIPEKGCFNFRMLQELEPIVETIDFSTWPKPCHFKGKDIRGVLVGLNI